MRLVAAVLACALAACNADPVPSPLVVPSASSSTPNAAPEQRELAKGARTVALGGARALETAARELELATKRRNVRDAARACVELRRAWRRIEPAARVLAPVAASQLDPEADEPDELLDRVGLRAIADALAASRVDWLLVDEAVRATANAAKLAGRELSTATWDARRLTVGLSRAVFEWGRRLDGSRAESDDELVADVEDGGRALLAWSELLATACRARKPAVADELAAAMRELERWIAARGKQPSAKLEALVASGKLGAAVRASGALLAGEAPRPPFVPYRRTRAADWQEPVHVGTFPALLGPPPRADRIELGAELFFDARLSSDGKLSCATCHRTDRSLAFGSKRPLTVAKTPVPRDVPAVWNVAYEAMHFWDGRASTLADQVRIAVENDMGGRWDEIVTRLGSDAELVAGFRKAFAEGLTAESVRSALSEFERTLVRDSTPLDRYLRGDTNALSAEMQRGFDVYFGKARCSRCHRMPLTSGTLPPRFARAEASAIGVPKTQGSRLIDPDRGRGAATRLPLDEHAFKVPTLRNLADTGPYFHNGGFATLEQVVDFYEKGSGAGLGIALPNFDPDADRFEISARERAALIVFLRDGLRDEAGR